MTDVSWSQLPPFSEAERTRIRRFLRAHSGTETSVSDLANEVQITTEQANELALGLAAAGACDLVRRWYFVSDDERPPVFLMTRRYVDGPPAAGYYDAADDDVDDDTLAYVLCMRLGD